MLYRILLPITLICGLFLTGCDGGLLEETPDTFEGEAEIFSTEAGAETALNGLYYSFSAGEYHGSAFHNLMMPVSGKFYSSQTANRDATGLNTTPSNIALVDFWAGAYQTINEANVIIANMNGSSLSNEEAVLGQAHFLRAVTYFDLVRMFGGVPLRTEPTSTSTLDLTRTSVDDVYAQIVADLEVAEMMLPTDAAGRPKPLAPPRRTSPKYFLPGPPRKVMTLSWRPPAPRPWR